MKDVFPVARIVGARPVHAEVGRQPIREAFVVSPSQDVPTRDRETVLVAQGLAVAGEERGGLVVRREERPTRERISSRKIEEELDALGFAIPRPRNAPLAVARPVRQLVLVLDDPDADAVPPQAANDAQGFVIAPEYERPARRIAHA